MATKNPRVVGYISSENHARLREFMELRSLTESKAIDVILSEFFKDGIPSTPSGLSSDVLERIADLERQMAEVLGESVA